MTPSTPTTLTQLANPTYFFRVARYAVPFFGSLAIIFLGFGLWYGLSVPDDYLQGRAVLIMFVHVPSVWLAMFAYIVMVSGALGVLVWRHPLADVAARCSAPLGATFTFLGLATGSIWGRPIWGTWWEWDARLTSFLVLFIIYLGLIALWNAIEEPARSARLAAVAVLVGAINIPIIRFSVDWFLTLHQPASILRSGGPSIDSVYLTPLFLMALSFLFIYLTLLLISMMTEVRRRRLRSLRRRLVMGSAR